MYSYYKLLVIVVREIVETDAVMYVADIIIPSRTNKITNHKLVHRVLSATKEKQRQRGLFHKHVSNNQRLAEKF